MKNSKEDILKEIIISYRNIIEQRYDYDNLSEIYELPKSINKEIVEEIKHYFLEYVYPNIERRNELNEAFNMLDGYIKSPTKLLNILKSSVKLVFKHRKHLGKILNAGLQAMKTFRSATKFENSLVAKVIEKQVKPPFNTKKVNSLIQFLSRKEIDEFINSTEDLFAIMYNKTLVNKIKEVIGFLISEMKKKPKLYSSEEIKGLKIGLEMIDKGERTLDKLSQKNQEFLIQFIIQVENDNLDDIFS